MSKWFWISIIVLIIIAITIYVLFAMGVAQMIYDSIMAIVNGIIDFFKNLLPF